MINSTNNNFPSTPNKNQRQKQRERIKKFTRKPSESSQRSSSRKSFDTSMKQMYIKATPKINNKKQDFFVSLASSIITTNVNKNGSDKKLQINQKYKLQPTDRTNLTEYQDGRTDLKNRTQFNQSALKSLNIKVKTLQAQLDLRNHQASILQSECQRLVKSVEQQRQKRKSIEQQRKQISKQLKQAVKISQSLKIQLKKMQKQREHFIKQIQFFERINYDDKTRSLQSYRQTYLQQQLLRLRKQFHKSRGQRQQYLQNQIKTLKQQKYTIQSHFKAMKVANQCLIKQINNQNEDIRNIVLNSQQYKKLRDKYVRFLEQYKLLRSQFWALKAQMHQKKGKNSQQSEIFSITASQVQNDLSQLKIIGQKDISILSHSQSQNQINTYSNKNNATYQHSILQYQTQQKCI